MNKIYDKNEMKFAIAFTEIADKVPVDKRNDFIMACDFFVQGINVGKRTGVTNAEHSTK